MDRNLSEWEARILQRLLPLAEGQSDDALGERWGLPSSVVRRLLRGERGIGPRTLERLRLSEPEIVARAFIPNDCVLVRLADPAQGGVFLDGEWTIDHGDNGSSGQTEPVTVAEEVIPCG